MGGGTGALRDDLASVFIQRPRLRNGVNPRQQLRIGLKLNLEAFLLAKGGQKDFLLDLAFHPIQGFVEFRLVVANILAGEEFAEVRHHRVVHGEILGDRGTGSQVVQGKPANTALKRIQYVSTQQRLLKVIELRFANQNVGLDSASTGHLPAAVGQLDFRWMLGNLAFVIRIERYRLVIALNYPATRRVITRDRER